jgi:beta-lactam-binding protein with PASTA domain
MTKSKKNSLGSIIWAFFQKHPILKHLVLASLFLLGVLMLTMLWLNIYTNHGQKIIMPQLEGMTYQEARKEANKKTFDLIITDSVFLIGKKGGLIQKQNPEAGSEVKENRKIYVTVTKFNPDLVKVKDLPTLYGNDFSQKKTELEYRGIKSTIKSRKYDPGEPNHILEVYYNDELIINSEVLKTEVEIEKGGTLDFVVSDSGGGEITIPSVKCMTLAEADFLLDQSKLKVGDVITNGEITDRNGAYILSQNPPYDGISKIEMGKSIDLTIIQEKPDNCM